MTAGETPSAALVARGVDLMDRFATHSLKVVEPYFRPLFEGAKPFEVRKNDRAYQRGDLLILNEWHPRVLPGQEGSCSDCYHARMAGRDGHYTGQKVYRWVTFVFSGDPRFPGVEHGCVVLGLAPAPEMDPQSKASEVAEVDVVLPCGCVPPCEGHHEDES